MGMLPSAEDVGGDLARDIGAQDPLGAKAGKKAANKEHEAKQDALDEKQAKDEEAIGRIGEGMKDTAVNIQTANKGEEKAIKALATESATATGDLKETLDGLGKESKKNADESKTKTQAQLDKIDKLTTDTDPKVLAEKLAKEQESITAQKMELAEKTLKQSEGLSKWYEGIATSYEDIGKRYKDAVTGLTDAEKNAAYGSAQNNFAAMSSVASQGMATAMRGSGPVSGNQMAVMAAASQRGATDAYSTSLNRIQQQDEQRRAMQLEIAKATSSDERANRGLGAQIESTQIGIASDARSEQAGFLQTGQDSRAGLLTNANESAFQHGMSGISTSLAGIDAMAGYGQTDIQNRTGNAGMGFDATQADVGFRAGVAGRVGDLKRDSSMFQFNADTYADTAGISMRAGNWADQQALDALRPQSQGFMGVIGGIAGAALGAKAGGPQGAAAGYQTGSALGSSIDQAQNKR